MNEKWSFYGITLRNHFRVQMAPFFLCVAILHRAKKCPSSRPREQHCNLGVSLKAPLQLAAPAKWSTDLSLKTRQGNRHPAEKWLFWIDNPRVTPCVARCEGTEAFVFAEHRPECTACPRRRSRPSLIASVTSTLFAPMSRRFSAAFTPMAALFLMLKLWK